MVKTTMTEQAEATDRDWSARAAVWEELWSPVCQPARCAVADAVGVGPGTRLLDVGCGAGEFIALAAQRGAEVAGLDAAAAMLAQARQRVPEADLRRGSMEALPWPDDAFDVVSAFNALQFAADPARALREVARVARPGGLVALCNWGRRAARPVLDVIEAAEALTPEGVREDVGLGEPGAFEALAAAAGLRPRSAGDVDAPLALPDHAALVRAFVDGGWCAAAVVHAGDAAVRKVVVAAAAPYRRPDGSYRFENRFRFLVAER
jgi:SAM-dependent methyltransferase